MLIYGRDAFTAKWVADKIPHADTFGKCVTVGVASNDQIIAGFVFNNYCVFPEHYYEDKGKRVHAKEHRTIELSMAAISPMWAKWEIIHEVLRYPFEQLDVYKVFTATPADNTKALKVNAHIGFKREAILAHQFGKKRHAVIMRMLRPDYFRLFGES